MPDTTVTTLQMSFKNAAGTTHTMSFRYPQTDLTSELIDAVMATILAKNIITTLGGDLVSAYDGGLVTRSFVDLVE